jgi:hypothetical protein
MQELERLTSVYKKWYPLDPFVQENYVNIEAGKNKRFNILNEVDLSRKYKTEYKLLKDNNLLKKPDEIPESFNGVKLTDDQKSRYMEEYWSEYIRNLDMLIGLTQEEMDEAKGVITYYKPSRTKLEPDEENLLNKQANKARELAVKSAEAVLGELIK